MRCHGPRKEGDQVGGVAEAFIGSRIIRAIVFLITFLACLVVNRQSLMTVFDES